MITQHQTVIFNSILNELEPLWASNTTQEHKLEKPKLIQASTKNPNITILSTHLKNHCKDPMTVETCQAKERDLVHLLYNHLFIKIQI